MAGRVHRIGSITTLESAEREKVGDDEAPSSEIRPLEAARALMLRVFMCMRGQEPQPAWLTVTDEAGTTFFEGWLSMDDGVEVVVTTAEAAPRVLLLLESARWHRQAHVCLADGLTEHVFV